MKTMNSLCPLHIFNSCALECNQQCIFEQVLLVEIKEIMVVYLGTV
jgi:hypothetical protein